MVKRLLMTFLLMAVPSFGQDAGWIGVRVVDQTGAWRTDSRSRTEQSRSRRRTADSGLLLATGIRTEWHRRSSDEIS